MSGTSTHLKALGISMSAAKSWIYQNVGAPSTIFQICREYSISNQMISEILNTGNINAKAVENFFLGHGLSGGKLDSSIAKSLFTITDHTDLGVSYFDRKISVFGVPIYASPGVEGKKILHAASIMAEYLDNDENGLADNQLVVNSLVAAEHKLLMWKDEADFQYINVPTSKIQDLGTDETNPSWHQTPSNGRFDAALEEVLHMITQVGYGGAYPDVFEEKVGTSVADAMDIARGGRFIEVPDSYPLDAWFTYNDKTTSYGEMTTEYIYWAITTNLGAQSARSAEIASEWKLYTPEMLQASDKAVMEIIGNPTYQIPTTLPDGNYM